MKTILFLKESFLIKAWGIKKPKYNTSNNNATCILNTSVGVKAIGIGDSKEESLRSALVVIQLDNIIPLCRYPEMN